jgi:hypothetical protein
MSAFPVIQDEREDALADLRVVEQRHKDLQVSYFVDPFLGTFLTQASFEYDTYSIYLSVQEELNNYADNDPAVYDSMSRLSTSHLPSLSPGH